MKNFLTQMGFTLTTEYGKTYLVHAEIRERIEVNSERYDQIAEEISGSLIKTIYEKGRRDGDIEAKNKMRAAMGLDGDAEYFFGQNIMRDRAR
jgi:hypothetical protein